MDPRLPLGSAADFVSGQRILSPIRGYLPHATTRDEVVFTDSLSRQSKLTSGLVSASNPLIFPSSVKDDLLPIIRHEDRCPVAVGESPSGCRRGSATGLFHARVDRDLAHQKKSLTDRELITPARQHDRRGLLLDDPEVDVEL
jgi:hypothetical protein